MAILGRSLLRLHKNLTLTRSTSHLSILRSQVGSLSRLYSDFGSIEVDLSNEESKRRLHNRLLYRSRQRGYLELDLVLGNWVEENIKTMDEPKIKALVDVLDLENPDLWKWLTGQEQPPEAVNTNPVFAAVRSRVTENLNHSAPETRANPGQPWVRGWDDKRGLGGGTTYGNQ
ncbi:succinate dehydrogenase assembly factor 2, mitochondrial [Asparagus officinalis]|uniref:succinate dehydrogenase assembly factor 2, mitochondrial n=1 Tax=Asparagus officinalis TaxID=4686 RepID=UPI00098E5F62|nr:succinate dehydrogenase assembly factor 2, mitochondrial [Asparagus officinalis]